MKILSVDFDFFQNVTASQLAGYPDGVDYSSYISEIIWANYYTDYIPSDVKNIKFLFSDYKELCDILLRQKKDTPVFISRSHANIIKFLNNHHINDHDDINITHIDLHHDMFNPDSSEANCGNWLVRLLDKRNKNNQKTNVLWVANPVYRDLYKPEEYSAISDIVTRIKDIHKYQSTEYDLIFICRSDTLLAPHFDKYFNNMIKLIKTNMFTNALVSQEVICPRNIEPAVKQLNKIFNERK